MAILVITEQPARVRRVAIGFTDDVVFEAEPSVATADKAGAWRLVLVDEEIGPKCMNVVAEVARHGNRVMLLSREPSLGTTMRAMRAGAYDVVALPADAARVTAALRPVRPHKRSWESTVSRISGHEWVGSSPAMLDAFRLAARAASGSMHVLLVGESGVGKELLARIIHEQSARAAGPFVAVNCGAHDETVLAVELFGTDVALPPHTSPVSGHLARAAGGTLFLDDVTDLSDAMQARLATALEEGSFMPIASFQRKPLDVRIIAAANRDLRTSAAHNEFREDLLYAFGAEINVPPLRRRTEDIPVLASYFLDHFASAHRAEVHGFDPNAFDVLTRYDWPGNVRQLRSIIERAVMTAGGRSILARDLAALLAGTPDATGQIDTGSVALEAVERRHIRQIWRTTGGHLSETADLLGIHRNTLRRKLEQYGITEEDARI